MNKFMAIWQLVSALFAIKNSQKGIDTIDNIFDMLEDGFPENQIVQNACTTGRILLNVPDDDD